MSFKFLLSLLRRSHSLSSKKCFSTHIFGVKKFSFSQKSLKSCLPISTLRLSRSFCTNSTNNSSEESGTELESEDIFDDNESSSIPFREVLNPNKNDPLIVEMNNCSSVQEVFDFIRKYEAQMSSSHISQAVIILWDLQKCFYKHNFYQECNTNRQTKSNDLLRNYITKVKTHDDFQKLLTLVQSNYHNFSMDALTCSLIYLNRMGVNMKSPVMQEMILKCENEVSNAGVDFPLTALSRFCVAIFEDSDNLWSILTLKDSLPVILNHLENCDTVQDLKLVTICLNKMHKLLTYTTLDSYKKVVEKLIDEQKLSYLDQRTILKCATFLSRSQWLSYNTVLVRKLFYILKHRINQLNDRELIMLFKVFQKHKEPADMLDEIQESASNRLSETDFDQNLELSLDLLSCIVSFSSPLQRPKFEELTKKYLGNNLTSNSLTSLYKILYHIKSNDRKLCNTFWDKTLTIIKREPKISDHRLNELLNLCHKYIYFNRDGSHNLYRYYKFESAITEKLLGEMEFGLSGVIPSRFSRIAGFILSFNSRPEVLEGLVSKIKDISVQLSIIDCLNLAKALQISTETTNFHKLTSLNSFYYQISQILDNCLENHLNNPDLTTSELSLIFRSFVFLKCDITSKNFTKILNYFSVTNNFDNFINTNILKDLVYNLQNNNCLVPDLIENLVSYCLQSSKSLLGTTVDKLLVLCYFLGYSPETVDEFCELCSTLIIRDKERFSGLSFIQAALALCYFNNLPEFLVKHIFSVGFLEQLDEELSHCYAKTTYPTRVRNNIMQLNRAVCLDYMECDVPWFHQKYVEQFQQKSPTKTHFHQKVHQTLTDVLKDEKIILENVYTPYGYHLDFEINLSKEGHSLPRKLAINILTPKAFTQRTKNLKGFYQLKKRHLEILGYEVIFENQNDWRELYTQDHCNNHVSEKIWPLTKEKNVKNTSVR